MILVLRQDVARHVYAACGGVGQGVRDTGAVADDIQTGALGLEIVVDLDFHIIELDLNAVEQSVVIGGAGAILSRA